MFTPNPFFSPLSPFFPSLSAVPEIDAPGEAVGEIPGEAEAAALGDAVAEAFGVAVADVCGEAVGEAFGVAVADVRGGAVGVTFGVAVADVRGEAVGAGVGVARGAAVVPGLSLEIGFVRIVLNILHIHCITPSWLVVGCATTFPASQL